MGSATGGNRCLTDHHRPANAGLFHGMEFGANRENPSGARVWLGLDMACFLSSLGPDLLAKRPGCFIAQP